MSKRPKIKQEDGTLVDLPLDAETLQGKTLEEIALKTDIPTKTSQLTNDSNLAYNYNITDAVDNFKADEFEPFKQEVETELGYTIDLSINSSTYVLTLNLKNKEGTTISTDNIDLPLETMVVSARYESGKLYLTTKNGNELEGIDISNIVSGLVPNTRTINGKALSSNITITKSDVSLGNVVNTGDSATPVSGGITKFTTGGAYTELNKKLGKNEKASDSDKLDGQDGSYYLNYNNFTNTPKIPSKTSELTNDAGFKTTDNNTTYTLSGSNSTVTLTPSSGTAQSITVNNVASATKATKDAEGHEISKYYLPLSGGNVQGNLRLVGDTVVAKLELLDSTIRKNTLGLSIYLPNEQSFKLHYNKEGSTVQKLGLSYDPANACLYSEQNTDLGKSNYQWNNIYGKTIYQNGKKVANEEDIPTKTSQLTNDSNYATTNQLFSKNYNDLTNKPSIPSSTSQLTNNSGFITNAVNNLTNYYLKSETYTKSEVQQLLSTISSLQLEVVTNLPTTNISSNTIYLKSLDSAKENNIYEEYIYVNSKWETIGTTAVDLSNYALKEDIPTKTSQLTNDSDLAYNYDITGAIDNFNADEISPRLERKFNYMTFTVEGTSTIYDLYQAVINKFGDDNIPCILQLTGFTGEKIGLLNISLVASTSVYKVRFIDLETALTYYGSAIVGTTTITEFIMSSNYKVNNTNFVTNDDIGTINPITGLQFVSTGNYLQASFYDESNKAITSFKTINGQSIAGTGDITIEGGSGDSSITDLGTVNSLDDDVLKNVTTVGLYKFIWNISDNANLICLMEVSHFYTIRQTILTHNDSMPGDSPFIQYNRYYSSNTWSSWKEYNLDNYVKESDIKNLTVAHNGPGYNDVVYLIQCIIENKNLLGQRYHNNQPSLNIVTRVTASGYKTKNWLILSYSYSPNISFTAIECDTGADLVFVEGKNIPVYIESLAAITEDMYTTYTYAKSTDIPTKTSQLENDSGYTKQEDLNNYLPLSGGTMTGNIEMPEYKGIVDSSEHSGFIFYGNYPAIANIDNPFVLCMTDDTTDGSEAHYYTFPNYDGKVVVKNSDGDIILNNEAGDDTYLIISADDTGLGEYPYIKMYHYGDSIYYGVHFITKETNNELYNYTFPEQSGTFVVKDNDSETIDLGSAKIVNCAGIVDGTDPYNSPALLFSNIGGETLITTQTTSNDQCGALSLGTPSMFKYDAFHNLKFPDTGDKYGDGSNNMYDWTLPSKSGTIALLEDLQGSGSGGVSEEDVLQIIEDNSSNTSQMDVDTSISIGTSADYNPNSDTQIPTTKAVQEMINVGGGSGGGSATLAVEITYDELKTLRDNSNLVAGQQYRITDFVTTTIQGNTKSAGHQFDIIVVADSTNTLNENARAIQHEGDTYFAKSNLSAWELKYDLDNDTTKYAWADEVNGKGVIYWLKDEWGNECPYDFKNIQFIRESVIDEDNGITFTNIYFYTFSAYDYLESSGIQSDIQDASIITKKESIDDYYNLCTGNIIKPYFNDVGSIEDPLNILNDIIFINRYSIDDASYFTCYSNIFGNDCYSNTFGNDCYSNTFGNSCDSNTFGNDCYNNTFGNGCSCNTFGTYCYGNSFGTYCSSNTFGNDCYSNTFGNDCYSNTFTQNYCQYIIIENGCEYLEITSDDTEAEYDNSIQNIHIHQGVKGTYEEQKVITVARNLDYETVIGGSGGAKYTAGEGITISEDNVISINYKNGDTEAY